MLIRGMFAFESLRGGKMVLMATLPGKPGDPEVTGPAPDYTGKLDITDFSVVNQSFLNRLFSAGSLTGVGDLLSSSGGITVDSLDVPFSSKNMVISIKDSIFSGPAVGGTIDGYVDRPHNQLALSAARSRPPGGITSIVSNSPLLGDVLASKKGEGIIGVVTYSATGNADGAGICCSTRAAIGAGHPAPDFPGFYAQWRQCAFEPARAPPTRRPTHRSRAAAPSHPRGLGRLYKHVFFPAA